MLCCSTNDFIHFPLIFLPCTPPAGQQKGMERIDIDTFQVSEGRLKDIAMVKRHRYPTFGADRRSDYTVTAVPRNRWQFAKRSVLLVDTKSRLMRVRGWLNMRNDPRE
jgi:hypothetical protein